VLSGRLSAPFEDSPENPEEEPTVSEPRGERVVDVVVVGAGPVGLWLAAELRLAGADVLVLERLPGPTQLTKSLTVHPRTLELLAMRGLADRCLALGKQVPSSHFALMSNRLDFTVLDTNYPFALFLPQPQLEAVLAEHANALGVPVLRSTRFYVCGKREGRSRSTPIPRTGTPPPVDGG
jgi:2-polyprenyl-6-methoxyphenol hydroxylase-like FAD-dependent oxidoreductase